MQDNQGVIWVRTAVGELCWVNEKEMRLHPYSECIKEGKTLDLNDFNISFVDQQKNLWISSGTKLSQLTFGRRQFQTQLTQPNIPFVPLVPFVLLVLLVQLVPFP